MITISPSTNNKMIIKKSLYGSNSSINTTFYGLKLGEVSHVKELSPAKKESSFKRWIDKICNFIEKLLDYTGG